MKALLDEQLSSEIAAELRSRGWDVEAVGERPWMRGQSLSDDQVMDTAASEDRALVTNNVKDYRPIAARMVAGGQGHRGLMLLPSTRSCSRAAVQPLTDVIERIMREHPEGLANSER